MSVQKENITAGTHLSYWTSSAVAPASYGALLKNIKTDVVVIGGGIAGLSVAYGLAKKGMSVAVVEDGLIGSGETGRTTAHLVTALDDRYYELERIHGKEGARLAAQSHAAAIDFIEATVQAEKIQCDFERLNGYLFMHPSDKTSSLEKEQEAASAAGVKVTLLNEVPGMPNEKGASLQFENQAQFHAMRYLYGLSEAIRKKGGEIFTETHADEITSEGIKTSEGFRISAHHVVIATNSPVNNKYAIHLKQFPYRSYVIGALVPKNSIEHALWWDTGDYTLNPRIPPYHYVRVAPHNERHDLLICGGEDHPTGLSDAQHLKEENRYDKLIHWLKERFSIDSIAYRWSGQVMEPMDSLAYIGRNPFDKKNVYIVTGDSGNGMTHGTIAGMLIPDLITGKENPWEKLYSPSRLKLLQAGTTLFKEFFGGLMKYMKESPKHTDEVAISSIAPGEGKIIEFRKEKFGVYRDTDSNYHIVSAVCTHLQCVVAWNNDEKSWDCPCHGSRFTITGKVMNGPANEGLWYYQEDQPEYLDILRNTDS